MTQDEIAKRYGVCRRNIGAILAGKTHQNVWNRDLVEAAMPVGKQMTLEEIRQATGLSVIGGTMLNRMIKDGDLSRVGKGLYVRQSTTEGK